MLSANDIFYVSGIIFLALIALVWLAHPVRGPAGQCGRCAARMSAAA